MRPITWDGLVEAWLGGARSAAEWLTSGTVAAGWVLAVLVMVALPLGMGLAQWLFSTPGDQGWTDTDEDYGRRVLNPRYHTPRD